MALPSLCLWPGDTPGASGCQLVILHLVLQWDQGPDGIKQGQTVGLIDDQLQVSHKHGHIHGPLEMAEGGQASEASISMVMAFVPPTALLGPNRAYKHTLRIRAGGGPETTDEVLGDSWLSCSVLTLIFY